MEIEQKDNKKSTKRVSKQQVKWLLVLAQCLNFFYGTCLPVNETKRQTNNYGDQIYVALEY